MTSWHSKLVADPQLACVPDLCEYFDAQLREAMQEVDLKELRGKRVEEIEKMLPGLVGYRSNQLAELEAIHSFLALRLTAIKGQRRRHYLEHYQRNLNPTAAEKYVEADNEVLELATVMNKVGLIRDRYEALSRQHEYLHFQLGNLSRLLAAGVNDAIF